MSSDTSHRRAIAVVLTVLYLVIAAYVWLFPSAILQVVGTIFAPSGSLGTGQPAPPAFDAFVYWGVSIAIALGIVLTFWDRPPKLWQIATATSVTWIVLFGAVIARYLSPVGFISAYYAQASGVAGYVLVAVASYAAILLTRTYPSPIYYKVFLLISMAIMLLSAVVTLRSLYTDS